MMKIGDYTLHAVQTGLFRLDGGAMFGVVPKSLWSKTNPADDKNRIDMCMKALLLVSDKKKILIDNGVGYKMSQKLNDIYGVDHSEFTLEKSLASVNLKPADITDVIITHLHFDHAGGSTYIDPEGNLKLTFPNAVHYIQKKQWDWANNPTERDKASYFPENFELIQKTKHLNLIEGDYKFDDYIHLYTINGHTPSQQVMTIQDDNTSLMYPADLIPMAAHVQLPYIMGYDLFPLTTLEEKKKYLPKLAEENWLLFFEHDPHTETARVEKTEKGFRAIDVKELSER
jgi:glyoxylase-like metal-dependent hydrolase (beta-lactamase superfamily II)